MNGKAARNLRKIVDQHFDENDGLVYTEKEHTPKLVMVGFHAEGTPRHEVVTPKTRLLADTCKRKLYQRAKNAHKQAVQAL